MAKVLNYTLAEGAARKPQRPGSEILEMRPIRRTGFSVLIEASP